MTFIVVISIVPFLRVLSSSFKGNSEILSSVVGYPEGLRPGNYVKAFEIAPFTTFYKNSVIVAIAGTAAYLDGAGFFRTFIRIILPLTRPAFAAAGVLQFLLCWNEFQFALTLTTGVVKE